MEGSQKFFSEESTRSAINGFLSEMKLPGFEASIDGEMLAFIEVALSKFLLKPEEFDRGCPYNIKHVSGQFKSYLLGRDHDSEGEGRIFVFCYRFFSEFNFHRDDDFPGSIAFDVGQALNKIRYRTSEVPKDIKDQIVYADNFMPVALSKEYLSKAEFGLMREFDVKHAGLADLIGELDLKLKKDKADVQVLHNALSSYKDGFNFVGLYKGFDDIARSKRNSARMSVIVMCTLAVLMVFPFAWKIWQIVDGGIHPVFNTELFVAFVGFDLLLLYFFKVVFHGYKSVKGQLVQLDLRRAACQFIQSYAKYAAEIKGQNSALLEKFEALVFSGIVANEDKIPSTFDGVEQLSKMIEKFKAP
ncbi:hypothetical protein [Pseudomonas sp. DR48]|uniref:hypothetical protein n=1 Tax=Pseudomonas sp. DR48 TaxID=2871095 RepID=UPI0021BD6055|nr:hypothetical protein [Pseudomonas sp. DR48]